MRFRTLITPFLVSLFLVVVVVLVPIYASAACCGCGNCWMKSYTHPPCVCNGTPGSGCSACITDDDSDLLQFKLSAYNGTTDTSSISRGLTSSFAKSNVTERVMELMSGGKCFRDRVALSLLGNARDGMKLAPVVFDEMNTLAFLIEADKEK
jgi:hypothetical protein